MDLQTQKENDMRKTFIAIAAAAVLWSIRRRPKSSRRTSPLDSPVGFSMAASFDPE
jgi:hypothetical protein